MDNYYVIPNTFRPDMGGKWLVMCHRTDGFLYIHDAYPTKKQALAVARDYNDPLPQVHQSMN